MKKSIALATAAAFFAAPAMAETVKLGVLLGFTGPIESLTPDMAAGAEMAMAEASKSGKFMGGSTIESVRGDSTCVDAAAATATAERLITSDKVVAIMGADWTMPATIDDPVILDEIIAALKTIGYAGG